MTLSVELERAGGPRIAALLYDILGEADIDSRDRREVESSIRALIEQYQEARGEDDVLFRIRRGPVLADWLVRTCLSNCASLAGYSSAALELRSLSRFSAWSDVEATRSLLNRLLGGVPEVPIDDTPLVIPCQGLLRHFKSRAETDAFLSVGLGGGVAIGSYEVNLAYDAAIRYLVASLRRGGEGPPRSLEILMAMSALRLTCSLNQPLR